MLDEVPGRLQFMIAEEMTACRRLYRADPEEPDKVQLNLSWIRWNAKMLQLELAVLTSVFFFFSSNNIWVWLEEFWSSLSPVKHNCIPLIEGHASFSSPQRITNTILVCSGRVFCSWQPVWLQNRSFLLHSFIYFFNSSTNLSLQCSFCVTMCPPCLPALACLLPRRYDSIDSTVSGRTDLESTSESSQMTSRQCSLESRHSLDLSDRWVNLCAACVFVFLLLLLWSHLVAQFSWFLLFALAVFQICGGLVPGWSCHLFLLLGVGLLVIALFLIKRSVE